MTGHIRQRSAGSWEIRYSLGSDPSTGRRKVATATIKGGRKDAERELRRLLRTVDTGEHVDATRMTIRQWLSTWLATIKHEVAARSHERYAGIVEDHLLPAFGRLPIAKLAPAQIQTLYNELAEGGRRDGRPGPLAPRTRRQVHRVLSAALARAVEQKIVTRNPCDAFRRRLPKVERTEMAVLTAEQSQRFLEAARPTTIYWPILLALTAGMRRNEILALRWCNVELNAGKIRIAESLEQLTGRAEVRVKPPKNGRSRTVTLPSFAVAELRRRKREQAEELLKLGARQSGNHLVCARGDGRCMTPFTMSNAFFRFTRRLTGDFPRIRFHDLRHTYATTLMLAGVHPRVAQELLGHSTVALTLDLYSHVLPSMADDAADKIEAAFGGASKPAG